MSIISTDIQKAVTLLNANKLVAIPTETVYGLAGNIYSTAAIKLIFKTKQRPFFNPLIVHIPSVNSLQSIASNIPKKAQQLADAFWPGPLTLVLPKKDSIPNLITADKNTVAVRVPNHPQTLQLLNALKFPLAAPSANPFNRISPTKAAHVERYFKGDIDMILDGGTCQNGIESTIIGFENNTPIIYRLGAITIEDIKDVIGEILIKNKENSNPSAPGMLDKHYAPNTKTILSHNIADDVKSWAGKQVGVLSFRTILLPDTINTTIVLSKKGDLFEATTKLYDSLHKLDCLNLDVILVEFLPDFGLGKSINDRLKRATGI